MQFPEWAIPCLSPSNVMHARGFNSRPCTNDFLIVSVAQALSTRSWGLPIQMLVRFNLQLIPQVPQAQYPSKRICDLLPSLRILPSLVVTCHPRTHLWHPPLPHPPCPVSTRSCCFCSLIFFPICPLPIPLPTCHTCSNLSSLPSGLSAELLTWSSSLTLFAWCLSCVHFPEWYQYN